jgi:acyl transferase domain-containing protein/aryl carrier-like protein
MRDVRVELDALRGKADQRIAIIGMGCRFPGASNPDAFWRMLCERQSGVREVPGERWDFARFFHPDARTPGKIAGRWGGFLEDLDRFDASFFGISPREAPHVDPRQRKMLEIAWEALEDAGIPPFSLAGSATGVYMATLSSDYDTILCRNYGRISASTGTGTANSIIANRLSYFLDLHGPSLTLDTACSGSLLTIELACRSLRNGETSLAMAGGVSINLLPKGDVFFSAAGALSPTGGCNAFEADADGIVRSEGAGVVVLKRLADAIDDGDRIYAVIRGGAINHDGASNGIMAPNSEAQKRVLREAYRNAGVSPGDVQYVEAHGTGTPLGDPIEISALAGAMAEGRDGRPLVLGSLKTNVGHMEAAAGVASVIKVALAMYHSTLPPNRQFTEWNPHMPALPFPMDVLSEPRNWPSNGVRRFTGVSAFSFGGTNAHLVLEEAPAIALVPLVDDEPRNFLLPLSAKSPAALQALIDAYRLKLEEPCELRDLCFTASVRRSHHPVRFAAAASNLLEMDAQLARGAAGRQSINRLAFVFSGQGSHWKGMGLGLMPIEPVFRQTLETCDRLFRQQAGWSILDEISSGERLDETDVSQAAIFSMQVALFELWRSWGIEPDAVIGQSLGEVAAAYASGALKLESAVAVVHHRSRLMKTLSGQGKTAVVGLSPERTRAAMAAWASELAFAGSSGPETSLVSGTPRALAAMVESLQAEGIFAQAIPGVDVALHSPAMESLRGELEASLYGIDCDLAKTGMMSTVTGAWLNGSRPDARYWGKNLCQPFKLADAIGELAREGFDGYLEVSPHALLGGPIRQVLAQANVEAVVLGSGRRGEGKSHTMMASLAALFTAGRNVNWPALFPAGGRVVSLPRYPWQRERYWLDQLPGGSAVSEESSAGHPFVGEKVESALPGGQYVWEREIDLTSPHYLSGHKVLGATLFPGAGYVEAVLAALRTVEPKATLLELSGLHFHGGMVLSAESSLRLQIAFSATAADDFDFQVSARPSDALDWTNHATGVASSARAAERPVAVESARLRAGDRIDAPDHYRAMAAQGLEYAVNFRAITQLWRVPGEALAELELDASAAAEAGEYCVHPILLDAALQLVAATIQPGPGEIYSSESYVPRGFDRVRFYSKAGSRVLCVAQLKSGNAGDPELSANLQLIDSEGQVSLEVEGLRLAHVGDGHVGAPGKIRDWLYDLIWEEQPRIASSAAVPAAWTIFADRGSIGAQLAENLRRRGSTCVLVPSGDSEIEPHLERIDTGIVYLRGLDNQLDPCALPLRLVKALATNTTARKGSKEPPLWIVTRGTQAAGGPVTALTPAAQLWGFARVVALEHPEMYGGVIDLEDSPADQAQQLADELLAPDQERQLAFRQGKRLVARVRPQANAEKIGPAVLRGDATYLITGGLGGLGLAVARWMVKRGARRFILAGRTALPARSEWRSLADDHPAKPKIDSLRELERLGASIHIAQLDVGDAEELRTFLEAFQSEDWPPVRGVIHAAGVVEDQFMVRLDEQSFAHVLRPKVDGTLALHHATLHLKLDFFTLFSSISSVVGQYGQAHYAAGNAFMDHVAHWRRGMGLPAISINWGPWGEVGLFAKLKTVDKTGRSGVFPMLPEQALQAMERIHASVPAQVLIVSADWSRMPSSPLLSEVVPEAGRDAASSDDQAAAAMLLDLLLADPDQRQTLLEDYLTVLAARVLRLDPAKLDAREPLTSYGMDSIMVVELKHHIERKLNLSIAIVDLFTGSVVKLAEQLAGKLANDTRLEQLLEQVENMSSQELEQLLGQVEN